MGVDLFLIKEIPNEKDKDHLVGIIMLIENTFHVTDVCFVFIINAFCLH